MTTSLEQFRGIGALTPARPDPPPLEALLARSGKAFIGVFERSDGYPPPEDLRPAIERAEAFLTDCAAERRILSEATSPATNADFSERIGAFLTAWPNASGADLSSYGAQLAQDVMDRRPCRYALEEGLRKVRQTSRFQPSIAEVLEAVDEAQTRIRSTAFHIDELPGVLDKAKAALAQAEARRASTERYRAEQAALRERGEVPPDGLQ